LCKSADKQRLSLEEMAALISVTDPDLQEEMFATARELKKGVYGNRIVLFAPLYIGNKCINSCAYCGFRSGNREVVRRTLTDDELRAEVRALLAKGHKRLVIDFGEHPDYDAACIAHAVEVIYSVPEVLVILLLSADEASGHRHLPDLPGDVPPSNLCARAPARAQVGLPMATLRAGPGHRRGLRRRRSGGVVRSV
jgi:2-iminoacetate synthase ThiH